MCVAQQMISRCAKSYVMVFYKLWVFFNRVCRNDVHLLQDVWMHFTDIGMGRIVDNSKLMEERTYPSMDSSYVRFRSKLHPYDTSVLADVLWCKRLLICLSHISFGDSSSRRSINILTDLWHLLFQQSLRTEVLFCIPFYGWWCCRYYTGAIHRCCISYRCTG